MQEQNPPISLRELRERLAEQEGDSEPIVLPTSELPSWLKEIEHRFLEGAAENHKEDFDKVIQEVKTLREQLEIIWLDGMSAAQGARFVDGKYGPKMAKYVKSALDDCIHFSDLARDRAHNVLKGLPPPHDTYCDEEPV